MKYIIDTDDLIEMIKKLQVRYHNTLDLIPEKEIAKYFVKDKKPVEEVASGEVSFGKDDLALINNKHIEFCFLKFGGKNIKIYIEEE